MFAASRDPNAKMIPRRELANRELVPGIFVLLIMSFFFFGAVMSMMPVEENTDPQNYPVYTGFVVDDAGILDATTIATLDKISADIEAATGAQFAVATIPDLGGQAIEDYGYQLGRSWGIGDKERNDGVILLVAPNDRSVRIEVGYGLEGVLTDILSSTIIENDILPEFRAGNMPQGILKGAQSIAATITGAGPVDPATVSAPTDDDWLAVAFLLPFLIVYIWPLSMVWRWIRTRYDRPYGDQLVPEPSRGSGRDNDGGWSSGGGSSSGGSRSSGGGSFGGGGASGRW